MNKSRWRGIRAKLVLVLLIPTLTSLVLAGLRLQDAVQRDQEASRAATLSRTLPDTYTLAVLLQQERDAYGEGSPKQVSQAQGLTNTEVAAWQPLAAGIDSSHDANLRQSLGTIHNYLHELSQMRADAKDVTNRSSAIGSYTALINMLLALPDDLPTLGDPALMQEVQSLRNVGPAAEALQAAREQVDTLLITNHLDTPSVAALATTSEKWEAAASAFADGASPDARRQFNKTAGKAAAPVSSTIASLLAGETPKGIGVTPTAWNQAVATYFAAAIPSIRQAAGDLDAAVNSKKDSAVGGALGSAALILIVLLLVIVEVLLASRSIVHPLKRLREEALDVAETRLPQRVRDLEQSGDPAIDVKVEPLGIGNRDEIAEVAAAFDEVHGQALALAGEQAQLRANVNRMVANLSRRSQGLVERQLRLIGELERNEQDPDHLANLFRLDHLATRMRRNDESLMVLAGGGGTQPARGEVRVLDVLRAASSEVEQYDRVHIDVPSEILFRGAAAGDLVHLLAELIENATKFSPPETPVTVRVSRPTAHGMVVEIADTGIGMNAVELVAANRKLATSTGLDPDVARMMGLVVVSRLAARQGLSVELRANAPRGTVARVTVPPGLLAQAYADGEAAAPQQATAGAAGAAPAPVARPLVPEPSAGGLPDVLATGLTPTSPAESSALYPAQPSLPRRTPAEPSTAPAAGVAALRSPAASLGEAASLGAAATDASTWFATTTQQEELLSTPRNGASRDTATPDEAARVSSSTQALPLRAPLAPPSVAPGSALSASITPSVAPAPVTPAAPAAAASAPSGSNSDHSPIYEALRSEWFVSRRPVGGAPRQAWQSPGDAGWRRAAELRASAEAEAPATTTAGGLPVRVPGRNLIAGSADSSTPAPAAPVRDPRRTGGLSGFQQGVSRARNNPSIPNEEAAE